MVDAASLGTNLVVSLSDAASRWGQSTTEFGNQTDWIANATIFTNRTKFDQSCLIRGSRISALEIEHCGLMHGHYPYAQELIVFERLHHNSEHTLSRHTDENGILLPKVSNAIRRSFRKRVEKGHFFLLSGPCHNLWHFMCNYAGRLCVLGKHPNADRFRFVVSKDTKPDFLSILCYLGIPKDRLHFVEPGGFDFFENLLVPECPFSVFDGALVGNADVGELWRSRVPSSQAAPRRIFISRRDAAWRRLINEEQVEGLLRRHGFTTVELSKLMFDDLVSIMASAEIIVGPSGANLAANLFCRANSAVIELTYDPFTTKYYFQVSSSLSQCRHYKVRGQSKKNELNYERWDFVTPLADLENALIQATEDAK